MRGPRPEEPCGRLPAPSSHAAARIAELQARYGSAFEGWLGARSALQAYAYLDLLERVGGVPDAGRTDIAELHDVGCAGFAYAGALQAYFRPQRLYGYDVEGYRRLSGGVTRRERVLGHLEHVPGAAFVVADYRSCSRSAACVTAFFPFVTAPPVLAWRLPLHLLAPRALFAQVRANLSAAGGELYMVNHDAAEAQVAASIAADVGLARQSALECARLDLPDAPAVVVSRWTA